MRVVLLLLSILLLADCSRAQPRDLPLVDPAPLILVDQFGYRPVSRKVAILRDPVIGFDAALEYAPSETLIVVEADTGEEVFRASSVRKTGDQPDKKSGDHIYWFDFSELAKPGLYQIVDEGNAIRSDVFEIGVDVYRPILMEAVRTLYYQRAGFAKEAPYATAPWTDAASHGQDKVARRFLDKKNLETARDLSGGWYDAGDYNQYTNWTARYVIMLLHSYLERPDVWTDDFGIPESGNGVPDLLDEVRWGLDWLIRMQNEDGSVLSILGRDQASPPSRASGESYYGDFSSSATISAAGVFALAGLVWKDIDPEYSEELIGRAELSLLWGFKGDNFVEFRNNDAISSTVGLGAGQQEVGRSDLRNLFLQALSYVYLATGDEELFKRLEDGLDERRFRLEFSPYKLTVLSAIELIAEGERARRGREWRSSIARSTFSVFEDWFWINASEGRRGMESYRAPLEEIHWGSNGILARAGVLLLIDSDIGHQGRDAHDAASGYLHYLHGVNPMGLVYLTNMGEFGAERSVQNIFHAWHRGRVPPPGFLVGGANQYYALNECCPKSCNSPANNAKCELTGPPLGQPPMKSFRDFSDGWPKDSWQLTEPSLSYQVDYIRLLAHFVGE
ncbi:MAG: glycoside hydrolase family 9 protein [Pseudomonadota bacterium]